MDGSLRQKDWTNIAFLSLTPIIGIGGTALYTWYAGFEWWMLACLLGMYLLVGLSICAGYHRYFAHKSYECSTIVRVFYALFGAMAMQNSILAWSAGHRRHHRHVDTEWDPYNIHRGFWWAHMFWIFFKTPPDAITRVGDLQKSKLVMWQAKWYVLIGLVGGLGLPTLIGACFGAPLAGLFWGGFLRIVVIHHTTFFINSIAHMYGSRTYSSEQTARDNGVIALLTLGEGYHSFHHRFPADFRNGVRWYQWDPTKWFISVLTTFGLASRLRRTPSFLIEQARMKAALNDVEARLAKASSKYVTEISEYVTSARNKLEQAFEIWRAAGQNGSENSKAVRRQWKHLNRKARQDWRYALQILQARSELDSARAK